MTTFRSIRYDERAPHYELEYTDTVDHGFLRRQVGADTGSILEVPCGVGRNVVNMAETGVPIVAVDAEPNMVRALEERLARRPVRSPVEAVVGDMRALSIGRRFDLIVVPREAFQLLTREDDAISALRGFAAHLSDAGRIVIDLSPFHDAPDAGRDVRPDYFDPALPDDTWVLDWERPLARPDASLRRHHAQRSLDDRTLRVAFRYETLCGGVATDASEATTDFALYTAERFGALVARTGVLAVAGCFGDYAERDYAPGSPRMIFKLKRKAPSEGEPGGGPGATCPEPPPGRYTPDQVLALPTRPSVERQVRAYSEENFTGPFAIDSGAEVILAMMSDPGIGGRALDLGAGPSTLFWYQTSGRLTHLACNDVQVEALAELERRKARSDDAPCHRWVKRHFGVTDADVERTKGIIDEYLLFDCFRDWPSFLAQRSFDLITAFGVLSTASGQEAYRGAIARVCAHLAPTGAFVGADWLRQDRYNARSRFDNSFLTPDFIRHALAEEGVSVGRFDTIRLADDPRYRMVVAWSGRRAGRDGDARGGAR